MERLPSCGSRNGSSIMHLRWAARTAAGEAGGRFIKIRWLVFLVLFCMQERLRSWWELIVDFNRRILRQLNEHLAQRMLGDLLLGPVELVKHLQFDILKRFIKVVLPLFVMWRRSFIDDLTMT